MALPETDIEIRNWLMGMGLAEKAEAFISSGWRGEKLLELTREELADLGVPKDRREGMMQAVEEMRRGGPPPTLADAHAPTYAPALTQKVIAACQKLGRQPPAPWVEEVAEQWPGPIAHEYQRLRQLLQQGQIAAAVFQFKDLAEVLVKFPALVMARDLIAHGDPEAARAVRKSLFSGSLAMGHWVGSIVGRTLIREVLRLNSDGRLLMPELAAAFSMKVKITTPQDNGLATQQEWTWLRALEAWVSWRNDELGHGAFRLDPQEYLPQLTAHLAVLNGHLAAQVAQGLWADVVLRGDEEPVLRGWQAIRHWHDGPAGVTHSERESPLWLEKAGRVLNLAPLVMLRQCLVCTRRDVFFYDSLAGRQPGDGFSLLDYLSGHRLSLPAHRAATLSAEAQDAQQGEDTTALVEDTALLPEDYGDRAVNALLEEKLLTARYLPPNYLREPVRLFVEQHERGVFWLTAPSHTGKSVFAHGLAFPAEVGDKPLWSAATAVVVFHIRREFKTWPEQLRGFIRDIVLQKTFGREAGRLPLPELEVRAADPAAAFAALLHEAFRLKPSRVERLVLILDGLDELPRSSEGETGIADFIPRPEALPKGCFLLLTSRPLADCPPHIRRALADRFVGCAAEFGGYALDLQQASSPGYYQLLRAYFDRELLDRLKNDLHQAFSTWLAGRTEVVCINDLPKMASPALREFMKGEWAYLTRAVRVRSPQDAPSLLAMVVQPVLDRYDMAFAEVRDRATDRFLYVAHLTDLLRDGRLALGEIAALPVGSGLYSHYLRQLQRPLVGTEEALEESTVEQFKIWAFMRRVILTLAAAEQAHVAFQQMLPTSVRDEVFRGVPLSILAALLDEPGRSVRLVFTLYSLKTVLAVWKGEDSADAHYALGLKDFTGAVAALWPEALQQTHRLLANQTLEALEGRWETVTDEEPLDHWRLFYLLAHAESLEEAVYQERVLQNEAIQPAFSRIGSKAHGRALHKVTVIYESLILVLAQKSVAHQDTPSARNALAAAYQKRGNACYAVNDLRGALEDYGCAITLREDLRLRLGQDWPPAWANNLAAAYVNRGVTHRACNNLRGALEDYGRAIDFMEDLRQRPGTEWPPAWANDLARAYLNRGVTRYVGNDLCGALEDYGRAIAFMEDLRLHQGQDWPPAWANDLAGAYMNRGNTRHDGNDLSGALEDYGRAIAFMEDLRLRQGQDWSPAWANNLAKAYVNRGHARRDGRDLSGALEDYGRAIAFMEDLRQRLGTEWPPAWANDLATAYLGRGNARHDGNDLSGALEDYGRSIDLMEDLRLRQGQDWLPDWANTLALTYRNRGIALDEQGDLKAAITDWHQAAQISVTLVEQHPFYAGEPLLKAIFWQLRGWRDLKQWPEAAHCLLQFLATHHHLQTAWQAEQGEAQPPWQAVIKQFTQMMHGLDAAERTALLTALGDGAEWIKELFGWP